MSSVGQTVGAIGGAVAGFFLLGGPLGAIKGAAYGAAIGGYIDPPPGPNLRGPTLEDKSFQSAAYGVSIPRLYGTIATMGNIIYLENNEYKAVSKKEKQGGKGGGGEGSYETTTYFATFAVVLAEAVPGSIPLRIWAGAKLVYQLRSGGVEFKEIDFKFYDGTQTEPDPRMEAVLGVGNCPSYEGTAYIVVYDLDLTDFGNGLAGCPLKVELGRVDFSEDYQMLGSYVASFPADYAGGAASSLWPMKAMREFSSFTAQSTRVMHTSFRPGKPQKMSPLKFDISTYGAVNGVVKSGSWAVRYDYIQDSVRYIGVMVDGRQFRNAFSRFPTPQSVEYVTPYMIYESGGSLLFLGKSSPSLPYGLSNVAPDSWYLCEFESSSPLIDFNVASADPGCIVVGDRFCVRITNTAISTVYVYDLVGSLYKEFEIQLPHLFANERALYRPGIFLSDFLLVFLLSNSADTEIGRLRFVTLDIQNETFTFREVYGEPTNESAVDNPSMSVMGNLICVGQSQGFDQYRFWLIDSLPIDSSLLAGGALLSSIANDWFKRSGLLESEFDTSALGTDIVRGYRVTEKTSARGALEQLKAAYLFDIVEVGYSIVCVKRGAAASHLITGDKLVPVNGKIYSRSKDSRTVMPAKYLVNYIDPAREYDSNTQDADYPAPHSSEQSIDIAIVMDEVQAARIADVLIKTTWAENDIFNFTLPQTCLDFNATNVIAISLAGSLRQLRIENLSRNSDQTISIQARSTEVQTYQSDAVGSAPQTDGHVSPIAPGDSKIHLMDLPLLSDSLDAPGIWAVAEAYEGWPGGQLMRSVDGGQSYAAVERFDGETTFAVADNVLLVHQGFVVDESSALRVWMHAGNFESITVDQLMAGGNYVAYGKNGRWEICQFANATPDSDGSVTLSYFVRGLAGTEWATGLHAVGDHVVLLQDPDNKFIGVNGNSLGIDYLFKSMTVGQSLDSVPAASFTYAGVNLKPLSPVNAVAKKSGGNWVVDFYERTRFSDSFWYSGILARREYPIAFEMDIYKTGLVIRTLSSVAPQFTYTAEQQISDFGSVQVTLFARIYQLNGHVGRGYPLEVNF